jgi:hypothetical protein
MATPNDQRHRLRTFLNLAPINREHPPFYPVIDSPPNPYAGLGIVYRAFRVYPTIQDYQFHAWGNLELVKLHFSRRAHVDWTTSMIQELFQDPYAKTVRWFMTQPNFNPNLRAFDIAVKNQAHSIIRIFLEFSLKTDGSVTAWLKTTACYEYLIRTENLAALQHLLRATTQPPASSVLQTCLEDLNHLELLRPPYQCRKSIRLRLYDALIKVRQYPETWPFYLILTVNGLTDDERLHLLRVTHQAGNSLPYQRDDIIVISFLTSRRCIPEYSKYLRVLIEMGLHVNAHHHDIYEDYLMMLLTMGKCDGLLWQSLLQMPTEMAVRCLHRVLDSGVIPAATWYGNSSMYDSTYPLTEVFIRYLDPDVTQLGHQLITILLSHGHRPHLWSLIQSCLRRTLSASGREFLPTLNLHLTLADLLAEKHCAHPGEVIQFQRTLQNSGLYFFMALTPEEQRHLEMWSEKMRDDLGDRDSNLIVDLSTIRTGELIHFRGFDPTMNQVNDIILPVKRCRINRVDLAYGLTIVTPTKPMSWVSLICQNQQPTYGLKIRPQIATSLILTHIRLFKIGQPSLLQLGILAVRKHYSRHSIQSSHLPTELKEKVYPKWLT